MTEQDKIRRAIRLIKKHRPRTPEGFAAAGVPLEKEALGAGVFREGIKVDGLPLVVKFPLYDSNGFHDGIRHSRIEIGKIARLRKFKWMRKYLPKVWYYGQAGRNRRNQFYTTYNDGDSDFDNATGKLIQHLLKRRDGSATGGLSFRQCPQRRIKQVQPSRNSY